MILGKNFDDISGADIERLITSGASETTRLEFKSQTYGGKDDQRREFLKDVSAFANSLGGQMIIGMNATNGVAKSVSPLVGISIDAELLRLDGMARAGIEPVISGLCMKEVMTSRDQSF